MNQSTITVTVDKERLDTLKVYMDAKGLSVEAELAKTVEALYSKYVPAPVQVFFAMKAGVPTDEIVVPRGNRTSHRSKVGVLSPEQTPDEV